MMDKLRMLPFAFTNRLLEGARYSLDRYSMMNTEMTVQSTRSRIKASSGLRLTRSWNNAPGRVAKEKRSIRFSVRIPLIADARLVNSH